MFNLRALLASTIGLFGQALGGAYASRHAQPEKFTPSEPHRRCRRRPGEGRKAFLNPATKKFVRFKRPACRYVPAPREGFHYSKGALQHPRWLQRLAYLERVPNMTRAQQGELDRLRVRRFQLSNAISPVQAISERLDFEA